MFFAKIKAFGFLFIKISKYIAPIFILMFGILFFMDMNKSQAPIFHFLRLLQIGFSLLIAVGFILSIGIYVVGLSIKEIRSEYRSAKNYDDLIKLSNKMLSMFINIKGTRS